MGPGVSPPPHLAVGGVSGVWFSGWWGGSCRAEGVQGDQASSRLRDHTLRSQVTSALCSGAKVRGKGGGALKGEATAAGPRVGRVSSSSSSFSKFPGSRPAPVPQPSGPRGTWAPFGLVNKRSTRPKGQAHPQPISLEHM